MDWVCDPCLYVQGQGHRTRIKGKYVFEAQRPHSLQVFHIF